MMMERVQGRPEAPSEAKNLLSGRPEACSEAKNMLSGRPEAPSEAKNLLSGRPEAPSEAKNMLSGRPEAPSEAKNMLSGRPEAPSEAKNSDLRHGNRDSSYRRNSNSYNFEKNFSIILSEATTKTSGRSSTSKLQENYFRKF